MSNINQFFSKNINTPVFRNYIKSSQTYIVPASGNYRIYVVGAGGGLTNSTSGFTGGSGAGGFCVKDVYLISGESYTVTVGAGGYFNVNNGLGGSSSFVGNNINMVANGGNPGGRVAVNQTGFAAGGSGGTASGGDVNFQGGDGGSVTVNNSTGYGCGGGGAVCIDGVRKHGGYVIVSNAGVGYAGGGAGVGSSGAYAGGDGLPSYFSNHAFYLYDFAGTVGTAAVSTNANATNGTVGNGGGGQSYTNSSSYDAGDGGIFAGGGGAAYGKGGSGGIGGGAGGERGVSPRGGDGLVVIEYLGV